MVHRRLARRLLIGTDCSGTDSPLYAIRRTNFFKQRRCRLRISHLWACDNSKHSRDFISLIHRPKKFFRDICRRKHSKLPEIDVYTCGFPCQPYSTLGKGEGQNDISAAVYRSMLATIRTRRHRSSLLENVRRLLKHNKGKTWATMREELEACGYHVRVKVYNSKDFGLPQSRTRVYIVGTRKDALPPFQFPPAPCISTPPISQMLDYTDRNPGALLSCTKPLAIKILMKREEIT